MSLKLRPAHACECDALSALCLRAKAHWGYDAAFLEACTKELTLNNAADVIVAELNGQIAGLARIEPTAEITELDLLYVAPEAMGQGVGRALFERCAADTRTLGCNRMTVVSDPHAVGVYKAMGAVQISEMPSGSIEGRMLPFLEYRIR